MTGSPQERTFGRGRFRTGHGAGFRRIAEKIEGICLQRRRSCREARADLDRERDGVDREHGPERGDWPRSRDAGRANRKIAAVRAHGPRCGRSCTVALYTAIMSGAVEFCKVQFRVASTPGMSSFELLI